jgi:TatD DNase family protein
MKLIDSHCHIDSDRYDDDREDLIKRIGEELEFVVNIGYDMSSSIESLELAKKYDFIYATVGFHPADLKGYNEETERQLEQMSGDERVVAIGEIGLDYHWMESPKEVQKEFFRRQMEIARRVGKPVVIHSREAMADTLEILDEYMDVAGIIHSYPGSYESAKKVMDRYYFGINGVLTFKNNVKTKEVVSKLPLEKIIIETDSPYLTPVPFRGKRNEPGYVKYVAQEIADIKGVSLEEVVRVTNENTKRAYKIR